METMANTAAKKLQLLQNWYNQQNLHRHQHQNSMSKAISNFDSNNSNMSSSSSPSPFSLAPSANQQQQQQKQEQEQERNLLSYSYNKLMNSGLSSNYYNYNNNYNNKNICINQEQRQQTPSIMTPEGQFKYPSPAVDHRESEGKISNQQYNLASEHGVSARNPASSSGMLNNPFRQPSLLPTVEVPTSGIGAASAAASGGGACGGTTSPAVRSPPSLHFLEQAVPTQPHQEVPPHHTASTDQHYLQPNPDSYNNTSAAAVGPLPAGYLMLTPEEPPQQEYIGICVPSSNNNFSDQNTFNHISSSNNNNNNNNMPSHAQQFHPSLNHLFLPPLALAPVTQQLPPLPSQKMMMSQRPQQQEQQQQRRPIVSHQRLSRANVLAIDSKDSRQARWHRVLSYVAQVRSSYAACNTTSPVPINTYLNDGSQSPTSSWVSGQERIVSTPPDEDVVDPLMTSLWGSQPMKIRRSLWDGGSCGTDGVDQFVWDDELDSGGNRFTLPPRSQQGDYTSSKQSSSSRENSPTVFSFEGCPTASSSESRRRAMDVDETNNNDEQRPSKRQRSNESLTFNNNNNNNNNNQIRVTNANISKTHALALEQYLETLRAIEKSRLPMMKKTIDYDYGFGGPDRWRQVYGIV